MLTIKCKKCILFYTVGQLLPIIMLLGANWCFVSAFQIASVTTSVPCFHKHVFSPTAESPTRSFGVVDLSNNQRTDKTFSMFMSSDSMPDSSTSQKKVDFSAITKYTVATVTQLGLFASFFSLLDTALTAIGKSVLPTPITWLLFYATSLKSRVFNPLNNKRPSREKALSEEGSPGFRDRIMPKWTPPGFVFPIMWLLIISSLRATSSTIVVNSTGRYLNTAIMTLILHLTCGDVWNTINNTEKRYGTSIIAIFCTYSSAIYAAFRYKMIDPLAGKLLGLTCVWLTIATSLITQTWRLNLNENGKKDSLLPLKIEGEKSVTRFWWQKD